MTPKAKVKAKKAALKRAKQRREMRASVKRGVAWLDLAFGRKAWVKKISLRRFDITDNSTCIAGHLFESHWHGFSTAMDSLGFNGNSISDHLGFSSRYSDWDYLQKLWVEVITESKKAL